VVAVAPWQHIKSPEIGDDDGKDRIPLAENDKEQDKSFGSDIEIDTDRINGGEEKDPAPENAPNEDYEEESRADAVPNIPEMDASTEAEIISPNNVMINQYKEVTEYFAPQVRQVVELLMNSHGVELVYCSEDKSDDSYTESPESDKIEVNPPIEEEETADEEHNSPETEEFAPEGSEIIKLKTEITVKGDSGEIWIFSVEDEYVDALLGRIADICR
jgi:hypothetical protein